MKAIILASGEGKRLRPLTNTIPKCLVEIDNSTILDHQISNLMICKISDIVITTGPFEEKLVSHVSTNYPHLHVTFVNNPFYSTTNYIYSLWLVKDSVGKASSYDDILLLHGDILFDTDVLKKLIESPARNGVLINNIIKPPEKDFKALIANNAVKSIGVNFNTTDAHYLLPLYRFSKTDFLKWMDAIEIFIDEGNTEAYAEDALNRISNEIEITPVYYTGKIAMEIDTIEDLEHACTLLKTQ